MRTLRQRKYLFALLVILALFAACKGESPTVPPIGSGGGTGGTPPPTGASVVITASNLNPISGSVVSLVVTVSQNGQPVPNGTAVELSTTRGNFVDPTTSASLGTATILTTNGGQVLVNLTSATAGATIVRAVVNNVAAQLSLNFQVGSVTPGGGGTAPTISSVSPAFGPPTGGQTVTITGTNFRSPARVLFDFGAPIGLKEAFVVSVSATQIVVLTPAVDLAAAQSLPATIKVIVGAGSTGEQSVTATSPFTFQAQVLTPIVSTISPDTGPIDGGTRITIFGSGFQSPVQVSFAPGASAGSGGWHAMQVLNTTFNQITAITPTARDVNSTGSGPLTGPVDLRVRNIDSNTEVIKPVAFRYTPKMQITAVGPTQGPATGGTRVTIDGIGFNDPVAVSIGGIAAQPLKVSGTQIIAVTLPLRQTSCGGAAGPIQVTNIDNGDFAVATGLVFTYTSPKPTIVGIVPSSVAAGGSVTISVAAAQPGTNKFTIGDRTVFPTSAVPTPDGTSTVDFTVTLPTNFTFQTQACTSMGLAGTQQLPLLLAVTYTNVQTSCTDTVANGLTVNPPTLACVIPPSATVTNPASGCATALPVVAAGVVPSSTTITIANNAATTQNLILSAAISGVTNATTMTITPPNATVPPGTSVTFTVTMDPAAPGPVTGNANFATNDPTKPTVTVCVQGTGT